MLSEKWSTEFSPLKNVDVECIIGTKCLWTFITCHGGHRNVTDPMENRRHKAAEEALLSASKAVATLRRLPGDVIYHVQLQMVCSSCPWHWRAWGKRTNESLHSIRSKYLQVINQASKLLNKICSILLP